MFLGTLDPASNRADWDLAVAFVDSDTEEALDLTGATIIVELRDRLSGVSAVRLSTGDGGVTIIDIGTFTVHAGVDAMRNLRADLYEVGGTCLLNGLTRQFLIGLLPVLDGVMT
jgi:hypothetical protein